MTEVRITVDKVAFGGDGVGRLPSGKVVFVPGALPGETLDVRVVTDKKSYARAELARVITPHPQRQTPECQLADRCGGCHFGHVPPQLEWRLKVDAARETIAKTSRVDIGATHAEFPAAAVGAYRRRIRLQIVEGELGYFAHGSHNVVGFRPCLVAAPALIEAADELEPALLGVRRGELLLELHGHDSVVGLATVNGDPRSVVDWLAAESASLRRVSGVRVSGPRGRSRDFGDVTFELGGGERLEIGAFTQANPTTNATLVSEVVRRMEPAVGDTILELYAGYGNFTFPLAGRGASVVAFDIGPQSLSAARDRARSWAAKGRGGHVTVEERDLGRGLAKKWRRPGSFSKVLLDPPRRGASKPLLSALGEIAAARVAYVSCDPASLGRDLGVLVRDNGYAVEALAFFDMFPRTFHVETLAMLARTVV